MQNKANINVGIRRTLLRPYPFTQLHLTSVLASPFNTSVHAAASIQAMKNKANAKIGGLSPLLPSHSPRYLWRTYVAMGHIRWELLPLAHGVQQATGGEPVACSGGRNDGGGECGRADSRPDRNRYTDGRIPLWNG